MAQTSVVAKGIDLCLLLLSYRGSFGLVAFNVRRLLSLAYYYVEALEDENEPESG